jgi:hypothetical protein
MSCGMTAVISERPLWISHTDQCPKDDWMSTRLTRTGREAADKTSPNGTKCYLSRVQSENVRSGKSGRVYENIPWAWTMVWRTASFPARFSDRRALSTTAVPV